MADHNPIYHLKDCYFFEVPKTLWRYDWKTLDDVPRWLRDGSPEITDPAAFREAMDGKILIPQPFAELQSLYAVKQGGFGISKYMILELVVAAVMVLVFTRVAARLRSGAAPRGRLANFVEAAVLFVRDQIARPAIDSHDHGHDEEHGHESHGHAVAHAEAAHAAHDGDRFVPLLLTLFFFVLGCNLMGMVPWAGSPTASFSVTLTLAAVTMLTVFLSGMRKFGPVGFFLNQVPSMNLPLPLAILLKPMIFLIEMLGLCIKHLILAVRLLANMVAGHLVLLGIMGLIAAAARYSFGTWATVTGISVVSCTLFSVLELFVAFLQAYIFTFLSALFIGAAVHQH